MSLKRLALAVLTLAICLAESAAQETQPVRLRGAIVTPSEVLADGLLTVSGNRIAQVEAFSSQRQVAVVETGSYIFPGLIDLHDHITWNLLPRWKTNVLFNNRYEWQQTVAYQIALSGPHGQIAADHVLACDADRFGEIKAIIGGSTSVVGGLTPTPNTDDNSCIMGLARNLDNYAGFDDSVLNKEKLMYEVFPFEMRLGDQLRVQADLASGRLKAFLIHVGEGKPSDASAAREFNMLVKRGDGFLRRGVSIIHGVALAEPQFEQLAANGVGLIWSPRSNIELYGATTNVRAAKQAGVRISIAPDWSPSGSDGLLEELKYAATWNAAQFPPVFSDSDLVMMATLIPAQLAGADKQIGSLAPGLYADLLLIRKTGADPYRALLHAAPADVRLVMVGGVPVYGDRDLMDQLLPRHQLEAIVVCGAQKSLYIESQKGVPETQKTFKQISEELDSKLESWGASLSKLASCNGQTE